MPTDQIIEAPIQPGLAIAIPRDLAVQIVGSDAGIKRRFRPTTPIRAALLEEELAEVEHLMQPFLESEIRRCHTNKQERMDELSVTATPMQAQALKELCLAYARHLANHLKQHGNEDRHHRSRQRMEQARTVVREINLGTGLGNSDGRGEAELREDLIERINAMLTVLQVYRVPRVSDASGSPKVSSRIVVDDALLKELATNAICAHNNLCQQ